MSENYFPWHRSLLHFIFRKRASSHWKIMISNDDFMALGLLTRKWGKNAKTADFKCTAIHERTLL